MMLMGFTAVTLMFKFLAPHLEQLSYYIPDRYAEGYGVSKTGMQKAVDDKVDLIITLDCGIRNVETINFVADAGVEVIVCDHHEPGDELPKAIVLDPKQAGCNYPFKELSGAGVGFKLLNALVDTGTGTKEDLNGLLDFLAISIGADLVSMTGENRILAAEGMKMLNNNTRPCFEVLLKNAGKEKPLTITDVVFTIAPRINAAGRMNLGADAVHLMLSEDTDKIDIAAKKIEEHNSERRLLDEEITTSALAQIQEFKQIEKATTVVADAGWSKGVVGIVASRLIEKHFKPTVVLAEEEGVYTGSARTVGNFNIYEALNACSNLFIKFGGHQHAAGLSMKKTNLQKFKDAFEKEVQKTIKHEEKSPVEKVHAEITFLQLFQSKTLRDPIPRIKRMIDKMEPFGPNNDKPQFLTKNLFSTKVSVLKEKHLRIDIIEPVSNIQMQAIGFFMAEKVDLIASGMAFDLLYTLEINRWKGKETLQLNIKDIRST